MSETCPCLTISICIRRWHCVAVIHVCRVDECSLQWLKLLIVDFCFKLKKKTHKFIDMYANQFV